MLIAAYGGMTLAQRGHMAWAGVLVVACISAIILSTVFVVRRVPDDA